VDEEKS
jgi:hypothetical protein